MWKYVLLCFLLSSCGTIGFSKTGQTKKMEKKAKKDHKKIKNINRAHKLKTKINK